MKTRTTSPALSADALAAVSGGMREQPNPGLDGPLAPGAPLDSWPLNGGAPQIELPPSPYEQWGVQL